MDKVPTAKGVASLHLLTAPFATTQQTEEAIGLKILCLFCKAKNKGGETTTWQESEKFLPEPKS